ncbi:flavodoxin family protein [Kineosporia babensis]|uniref:Flavodoxin-like domain-containing protein n=1 Tax=Kineosporia babensis TaxID=499548 RepID=A0A9X1NIR4_9ACTN|nr:hypothetical protein [Kineosporia babensis]MCD5314506.1 hypothetical protein [Kineosporia babensis]
MRALVVYESMFGNTEKLAEVIAQGIGTVMPTEICEVGEAPQTLAADIDLLVVGAPTHAHGLSRPSTRGEAEMMAAAAETHVRSEGIGVREWLAGLESGRTLSAAFDTHVSLSLPGRAARSIERRFQRLGLRVLDSRSFPVKGKIGPITDAELVKARRWAESLASTALAFDSTEADSTEAGRTAD